MRLCNLSRQSYLELQIPYKQLRYITRWRPFMLHWSRASMRLLKKSRKYSLRVPTREFTSASSVLPSLLFLFFFNLLPFLCTAFGLWRVSSTTPISQIAPMIINVIPLLREQLIWQTCLYWICQSFYRCVCWNLLRRWKAQLSKSCFCRSSLQEIFPLRN